MSDDQFETIAQKLRKAKCCGDFFERNEHKIRLKYRETAKAIHPDLCSNRSEAIELFEKLNKLRDQALQDIQWGTWTESNVVRLPGFGAIHYRHGMQTEFGERYVTDDRVIWIFNQDKNKYKKLFTDGLSSIDWSRFNSECRDYHKMLIGSIERTTNNAISVTKNADEYPFDLFLATYKDKLDGRDLAWMISRMCDLACFLKASGIVHNGLEPINLFIRPKNHTIAILGGWQYAVKRGQKMTGVSREIFDLMPSKTKSTGIATSETDIESIRRMFQKIAQGKDDIPVPVMDWIMRGSTDDARHEFILWDEALEKAYGVRKFKVFSAEADKIYSQN